MDQVLKKLQDRLQEKLKLKKAGGSKYFGGTRRGETAELAADLAGNDKDKQRQAVKRIIANMTMGRDVSSLFVDVVKLGQTFSIEVKKLVYLYVLNTAKMQPDNSLMALNTFLKDVNHQSPIIRALAVRTMLCVRVEGVLEYTLEPLRRAAADPDPYVRKAAAIGLGKLYHQSPQAFHDHHFGDVLAKLLTDSYSVVSANAAAVLHEVATHQGPEALPLRIQHTVLERLLQAVPDATEWGQCALLETLAAYAPQLPDAKMVIERTLPRLGHTNAAVVMAAIKLIATLAPRCQQQAPDFIATIPARINSALLTLTKLDHETQFVVFRNIRALHVLFPGLLANNIDCAYIRYNDPPCVKLEKLHLLLKLATPHTAPQVLSELAEASAEVDVQLAREVIYAIGHLAIRVEGIAPQCADLLMAVAGRRGELVPAIVVSAKNIVRRYPDLLILGPLVRDHGAEGVAEEDARCAFVWMLGEFCDYIEGGPQLLQGLLDGLLAQEASVQLALMTAVVKLFLRNPEALEPVLTSVLEALTQQSRHPDTRDRAYMYWRILSKGLGVERMKRILHGPAPPVDVDRSFADGITVADLRAALNTAAVVYGRPARAFLPSYGLPAAPDNGADEDEDDLIEVEDDSGPAATPPTPPASPAGAPGLQTRTGAPSPPQPTTYADPMDDLFAPRALPAAPPAPQRSAAPPAPTPFDDPFGDIPVASAPTAGVAAQHGLPVVYEGEGLVVGAEVAAGPSLVLLLTSRSHAPLHTFAMQINRSPFGLQPRGPIAEYLPAPTLGPHATMRVSVPLMPSAAHVAPAANSAIEVGLKSSAGLVRFHVPVGPLAALAAGGSPSVTKAAFAQGWRGLPETSESRAIVPAATAAALTRCQPAALAAAFASANLSVVFQATRGDVEAVYFAASTCLGTSGDVIFAEAALQRAGGPSNVTCRCGAQGYAAAAAELIAAALEAAAAAGAGPSAPTYAAHAPPAVVTSGHASPIAQAPKPTAAPRNALDDLFA